MVTSSLFRRALSSRRKAAVNAVVLLTLFVPCSPLAAAQEQPASPQDFQKIAAQAAQARAADRLEEAIALYRKALSLRPKWDEGWWYLGTLLYDRDEYTEAAQAFKQAAALNPKLGMVLVMLGLCEFKLGSDDAALLHIQQGRRLGTIEDPQFRHAMLYNEGLLLLNKGAFGTAQETLDSLSSEGVDSEALTAALGCSVLRIRLSNLPLQDSTTRETVRRAGRAEHFAAQKKFDDAMREYGRLVTNFPTTRNVQYAYGRFLLATHRPEEALPAFQREIENTPMHVLARLEIAAIKYASDPAGALPFAEEAVKLNPQIPFGHYLLGLVLVLLETDQTARAISELETAQRSLPDEPKVYFALARAYARASRKKDAERARATFLRLNQQIEEANKSSGEDQHSHRGQKTPSDAAQRASRDR